MTQLDNRRPLASRDTNIAKRLAVWLSKTPITPNHISQCSILMAVLAGGAFYFSGTLYDPLTRGLMLAMAAGFCQLRLLCNLLDGMVAVEGGKGTPDGAFWNELPDRISDVVIFIGVGYGLGLPSLGWAVAVLAVLTAYVRELGVNAGAPADFSGPMAKPHRMALISAAALIASLEFLWAEHNQVLWLALWIVALGTAITIVRRSVRLIRNLCG